MINIFERSHILVGIAALASATAVGVLLLFILDNPIAEDAQPVQTTSSEAIAIRSEAPTATSRTPIHADTLVRKPLAKKSATNTVAKAATAENDDIDKLMDEVIGEITEQLQNAVKRHDVKGILALVKKLRSLQYGAKSGSASRRGVSSVKHAILGALATCGIEGIPEIAALIGDSDPAIAQEATSLVFKTLNDISLSDSVRAEIVVAASEEMTDAYSLTRLYNEFIKMRHSVGATALTEISKGGTAEAKAQLARVISAFTGDATITTASQLSGWLEEHPDADWDDKLYGGIILEGADSGAQAE